MRFQSILAIKLREIGDAVIWTSALQNLRSLFPEAKIDVLVTAHSEPVLRGQPWIDRIHTVPSRTPLSLARQLLALRTEGYDLALGFHATNTLCNMIPLLGSRHRILYHHKRTKTPRFSTFSLLEPGKLENAISRDHQVIRALGMEAGPRPPPRLELGAKERSDARRRLLHRLPDLADRETKLLGLLPGGSRETKRYPRDLWLRLLDRIDEAQVAVAIFVDPQLSQRWGLQEACAERGLALFDNLSLRQLMGCLSWTNVIISNDSGPKHIAVALGAKSLTLFGPSEVGEWHPYDRHRHPVLRVTVPCRDRGPQDHEDFRFCTVPQCGHLSCLREIDPELIWSVARSLLVSSTSTTHRRDA